MSVNLTAFRVRNFKRLLELEIAIPPDGPRLYVIGGDNGQGKSSALDALSAAFGGKTAYPPDPVHHGERRAEIVVEMEGEVIDDKGEVLAGRFAIRRTITPDGGGKLEIRGPQGEIKPAQAWLDRLVGSRFLDPLAFLAGERPEDKRRRRAQLIEVAGLDTSEIDAARAKLETERRIVGQNAARAKGEYERLPEPEAEPPKARGIAAITEDLAATEAKLRDVGLARVAHQDARRRRTEADRRVEDLRAQLATAEAAARGCAEAEATAAAQVQAMATGDHEQALQGQRTELAAEMRRSETWSRWAGGVQHARSRKTDAERAWREAQGQHEGMTDRLRELDERKEAKLAAATLPVAGLAFTDDGVVLNGVPFEQASQAERFRTAMAVAIRLSPHLRAVWVKDGSLLDDRSLALLAEIAEEAGCLVIVERVGNRDPGAIVIHDGRRLEPAPSPA